MIERVRSILVGDQDSSAQAMRVFVSKWSCRGSMMTDMKWAGKHMHLLSPPTYATTPASDLNLCSVTLQHIVLLYSGIYRPLYTPIP